MLPGRWERCRAGSKLLQGSLSGSSVDLDLEKHLLLHYYLTQHTDFRTQCLLCYAEPHLLARNRSASPTRAIHLISSHSAQNISKHLISQQDVLIPPNLQFACTLGTQPSTPWIPKLSTNPLTHAFPLPSVPLLRQSLISISLQAIHVDVVQGAAVR